MDLQTIRQRAFEGAPKQAPTSTAVDLPLSEAGKRVLARAAIAAERLAHRHIGTEHLFLGLLDEEECFAAKLLREAGADAGSIRVQLADSVAKHSLPEPYESIRTRGFRSLFEGAIIIHGIAHNAERVRDSLLRCRRCNFHWYKRSWTSADTVIARKAGKVFFDLSLAADGANFELVKGGWKKDHCYICSWELFESDSDADHGSGYTNGRDWVCAECYMKFWRRPDFFASSYSDIT